MPMQKKLEHRVKPEFRNVPMTKIKLNLTGKGLSAKLNPKVLEHIEHVFSQGGVASWHNAGVFIFAQKSSFRGTDAIHVSMKESSFPIKEFFYDFQGKLIGIKLGELEVEAQHD